MTQPIPSSQKRIDGGVVGGPRSIPSCVVGRFNFIDTSNSQIMYSTLDGSFSGGFNLTPALATAVSTPIMTSFATHIAPFMPTTFELAGVDLRDLSPPGNNAVVSPTGPAPVAGTSASTALPHEVAVVLTKRTAKAGRGFRGRMYIPGWAQNADVGDGTIAPAVQTALNLWCTDILAAYTANGLTPCIGQALRQEHFGTTGTLIPVRPAGTVPITSLTCRNLSWDTQRRRGLP